MKRPRSFLFLKKQLSGALRFDDLEVLYFAVAVEIDSLIEGIPRWMRTTQGFSHLAVFYRVDEPVAVQVGQLIQGTAHQPALRPLWGLELG